MKRLDCGRRRHGDALAASAALTTVRLGPPIVLRVINAAHHVGVGRHYFGGGCADGLFAAAGAIPTSSGTYSELGWDVATASEAGRHKELRVDRVISEEVIAGGDERDEGVHAKFLRFGSGDGVPAYAEGGIGGCEPSVDPEALGKEDSLDGVDGAVKVAELGDGAVADFGEAVGIGDGEEVDPFCGRRLVVVVHPGC